MCTLNSEYCSVQLRGWMWGHLPTWIFPFEVYRSEIHTYTTIRLHSSSCKPISCLINLIVKLTEHCPFREFEAAEKNFDHVIKDLRKLKSIQIDVKFVSGSYITNQFLYELFKSTGVLVIFGKVKETKKSYLPVGRQKGFEDFLEQDPLTFGQYMIKKRSFAKWCENNPGYGY